MNLASLVREVLAELRIVGTGHAAEWFRAVSRAADEAEGGAFGDGAVILVKIPIGTAARYDSNAAVPSGSTIIDAGVDIDVTTPYSPGTTITVGGPTDPDRYQEAGDNTATVGAYYPLPQNTPADPGRVSVTITGAPIAGAGEVLVRFARALS